MRRRLGTGRKLAGRSICDLGDPAMKAIVARPSDAEALGDCPLFRGLTDEERNALVASAPTRAFLPDETIFRAESPGDTMMVVLSGRVRISLSSPDGKELMLAIAREG